MIQKLRRKFILINMAVVALVLVIVFSALALSAYRELMDQADAALTETLSRRSGAQPARPQVGKEKNGRFENMPSALPAFCVQLDEANAVADSSLDDVSISDETLSDAIARVLASGHSTGQLLDYDLKYSVRFASTGTKIAFVDLSGSLMTLQKQGVMLLIGGICGLIAFFFISLYLSDWALKPAELAWARQRRFVADASSQLKSPLSDILSNLDQLLSHPDRTVEEERLVVEGARHRGLAMKKLVDDMLFLAETDASLPPAMEPVCLPSLINGVLEAHEPTAQDRLVAVTAQLAEGVYVYGNEDLLRRLVHILISNAIRNAGVGGHVEISLTDSQEQVSLLIRNSGVPIDPADLPHIFERFYQTEEGARPVGGIGLELSIAQSIAALHGADIQVTSSEQEGTAFLLIWHAGAQRAS